MVVLVKMLERLEEQPEVILAMSPLQYFSAAKFLVSIFVVYVVSPPLYGSREFEDQYIYMVSCQGGVDERIEPNRGRMSQNLL
jgi:hypothetical protein